MVTYGAVSGTLPTVQARSLFALKYVTAVSITAWRIARPDQARADMAEVAGHWNAGRLRTAIHASGHPWLALLGYPFGLVLHRRWRRRHR